MVAVGAVEFHETGIRMSPMDRDERMGRSLRTPRAAAIAGVLFALLLATTLALIRLATPSDAGEVGAWLSDPSRNRMIVLALELVPFEGIAFLWFIGVVRDRIGQREDRFFATVFLGSGLLFVALLFVASAVTAAFIGEMAARTGSPRDVSGLGRRVGAVILHTYAMRMAAVFTISTATIGVRTRFIPRWLAFSGYAIALVLLLVAGITPWIELIFPVWILLFSLDTLIGRLGRGAPGNWL
jgi:hypothetical protein